MRSFLTIALLFCLASVATASWSFGGCTDATCTTCAFPYVYPTNTCLEGYSNSTRPWTTPYNFWCDEALQQINRTAYAPADTMCTGNYTLFPFPGYPEVREPESTACAGAGVNYRCTSAASSVSVSALVMTLVAAAGLVAAKLF